MGLEADCTVRVGRKASSGKAQLESERLIFRGDFRLEIPFDAMRDVLVDDDALVVKTADQEARFELGAAAADHWLRLVKEPKGLFEKLEVAADARVAVVDVSDSVFLTALRDRTAGVTEGRVPQGAPIIFFGAETRGALRKIQLVRQRMADSGVLWIIRPKGSRAISESDVLETLRAAGLADTKVVAFSKTHTAHKCVVPLELRGRGIPRPRIVSIPPPGPFVPGKAAGTNGGGEESTPPPRTGTSQGAKARPKKLEVEKKKSR